MRFKLLVSSLFVLAVSPTLSLAQAKPSNGRMAKIVDRSEVALDFTAVRTQTNFTNTGQSSGFTLAGASATAAYKVLPHLSGVVDFSGIHVNGVQNSGLSLTELIYQVGGRYSIRPLAKAQPFAQVLVGAVHATGGLYPANNVTAGGATNFAMTLGGGVDFPVTSAISLRGGVAYLLTTLPNGGNNEQGSLRVDGGLVFRFGKR